MQSQAATEEPTTQGTCADNIIVRVLRGIICCPIICCEGIITCCTAMGYMLVGTCCPRDPDPTTIVEVHLQGVNVAHAEE